jgi:hypothetical protein
VFFQELGKMRGYELVIEFSDGAKSCVQIIAGPAQFDFLNTRVKFHLKDPAFMSLGVKSHSFYFGKAHVRPLHACSSESQSPVQLDGEHFCNVNKLSSESKEIGVVDSTNKNEFKVFDSDYCDNHNQLSDKVCVKKYKEVSALSEKAYYYIVMQPMPREFDTVRGDLNIFALQKSEWRVVQEAKRRNQTSFVDRNITYYVHDFEKTDVLLFNNVFAHRYQMLENGLVFKLIKHDAGDVGYSVSLLLFFVFA